MDTMEYITLYLNKFDGMQASDIFLKIDNDLVNENDHLQQLRIINALLYFIGFQKLRYGKYSKPKDCSQPKFNDIYATPWWEKLWNHLDFVLKYSLYYKGAGILYNEQVNAIEKNSNNKKDLEYIRHLEWKRLYLEKFWELDLNNDDLPTDPRRWDNKPNDKTLYCNIKKILYQKLKFCILMEKLLIK